MPYSSPVNRGIFISKHIQRSHLLSIAKEVMMKMQMPYERALAYVAEADTGAFDLPQASCLQG